MTDAEAFEEWWKHNINSNNHSTRISYKCGWMARSMMRCTCPDNEDKDFPSKKVKEHLIDIGHVYCSICGGKNYVR
jgi:hypothetical protein